MKIRGFRLEPEEIETVLKTHPAVGQAIVLATETIPGEKRLIAYVVSAPESGPTAMELDAFLRKKLPAYMVPATFVFLGSLPLTPNGKIDRRGLPAPSPEDRNKLPAVTPPRNEIERELVQIWEEELAVRPISVRDNFFDLGGHSLLSRARVRPYGARVGCKVAACGVVSDSHDRGARGNHPQRRTLGSRRERPLLCRPRPFNGP